MKTTNTPRRIHPLLAAAAVAIILVCATGIAAMTGLLPFSKNTPVEKMAEIPVISETQTAPPVEPSKPAVVPPVAQSTPSKPKPTVHKPAKAPAPAASTTYPATQRPVVAACAQCGVIETIRGVEQRGEANGLGVAAGAIVGGLLGTQIGDGRGRTLATIAGAVGGGLTGNEVEKRTRATTSYIVEVRMDNGSLQTFPQSQQNWRVGELVRIENGQLMAR